jgi:hypothetical protein
MKITKKELKEIILQELNDVASSQDDPIGTLKDFETFAFTNHIEAIMGNFNQMDQIIREDEGLDRKTLIMFKEKLLADLHLAVSHLEGAIDARLKKQNENF